MEAARHLAGVEQRLEHADRGRPLNREHRVVGRPVDHLNLAETLGLLRKPGEIGLRVGSVHNRQKPCTVPVGLEPVSEEVVEHAAILSAEKRVLSAPAADLVEVVGEEAAQEVARTRTAGLDLTHVGDVEDPRPGSHRHVLGTNALVLDRHLPAREGNHPRTGLAMSVVKGGSLEGRSGHRHGSKDPSNGP
jgi:hypothetical protein